MVLVQRVLPLAAILQLIVSVMVFMNLDVIPSPKTTLGDSTTTETLHYALEDLQVCLLGVCWVVGCSELHMSFNCWGVEMGGSCSCTTCVFLQ